ncbi:hypothetical protein [Thermoflexus sp.]|uniref:hypothetical protein n=2 Tax=Thermoflexus sp. TaxID=1969742 RepID=UPI0025CFBB6A|nr:hypothetical protein [Thermoflexus sp.]MCS7349953.1 hypothetical protein [Thermoflexus sp.]MCX7689649.1 hypothetical protein [Thermoflexus sp.]MDW8179401.1 hypothetical protein [Anaerolineae bacterium]
MEEFPARLLLGESALPDIPQEIRKALPRLMERPAGRRYGIWLGIYAAIAALADPDEGRGEATALEILRYLHARWEDWTGRERISLVRGWRLAAYRRIDRGRLDSPGLSAFFRELALWLAATHPQRNDLRLSYDVNQLLRAIGHCGDLPPAQWLKEWSDVQRRQEALMHIHHGMIERLLWRSPFPDWALLHHRAQSEIPHQRTSTPVGSWRFAWRTAARQNGIHPAMWDLIARDPRLYVEVLEGLVEGGPQWLPPRVRDRIGEISKAHLQRPGLDSYLRSRILQLTEQIQTPRTKDPFEDTPDE